MLPTRAEIKSVLSGLAVDASASFNGIAVVRNVSGYNCATLPMVDANLIDAAIMVRRELQDDRNAGLFVNLTDSNTVANTTTETTFAFATEAKSPAGWWYAGRVGHIIASFRYSTTSNPTIRIRLKINGGTALDFGAQTAGNNVTNRQLYIAIRVVARSVGTSGVIQFVLDEFRVNGTQLSFPALLLTGDNVQELTYAFSAQWSAAAAGNTIVQESMIAEAQN